ncbi:hypothetical protein, partial [Phocaeicola plebeius]
GADWRPSKRGYPKIGSLRVDHTLTWKIKILGKQVEYGIKQIIEYLIPASFLKEMKIRNRKRLEHRK